MTTTIRTAFLALAVACLATPSFANDPNFESPPVHPVDMSPDGTRLFVAHTADHRLVIFDLTQSPPLKVAEVMVGLEPVTVRARDNGEVWVINHVSDSISIVRNGAVVRTLLVGDEPTDVVFTDDGRAFVCISQEDLIRVYDLADLNSAPVDIPLEGSDPRSLATSPDGATVYVTIHDSGNRTTVIPADIVTAGGGLPAPNPPKNGALPPAPAVSLIVQYDGANWVDENAGVWTSFVPYTLPDNDVYAIDKTTLVVTDVYQGVGTALFNVGVHPSSGELFVTNQEAFNLTRFEPNLKGRFAENRVTRIDPGTGVATPQHINTHINYAAPSGDPTERALSLSMPLDIVVSGSGDVFVAAFGSRKVGVLDTGGNVTRRITVGEGPAGLALDTARDQLYVFNRFTSSLSVVDLTDDSSVEIPLGFDPSPAHVRDGRRFLYDGEVSSAHGDLSCATCHIFGGMDNIAWDLGDPTSSSMIPVPPGQLPLPDFHPMKGPMTTQALKGLPGTEPLHWRGDRADFAAFNPAFEVLMGAPQLTGGDFQLFEDFVMSIRYPSNPFRNLDGSLPATLFGADPVNGENLYLNGQLVGGAECVSCHSLPTGENGLIIPGGALLEPEAKVVPQLRNLYEKTRFDDAGAVSVRGYGFIHDGSVQTLVDFLQFPAFTFANDSEREDVAAFLLAFQTETHPAAGAQWTMDGTNEVAGGARLSTLEALADNDVIGLVAKGRVATWPRGWTYMGAGTYRPDKEGEPDISTAALLALAGSGKEVTFTGVVDGCEWRIGVDRDLDGFRDGDELAWGSDPGDPASTPSPTAVGDDVPRFTHSRLWIAGANPTQDRSRLGFEVGVSGPVRMDVYDVRGRLVRRIVHERDRAAGVYDASWDLHDHRGQAVSSGVYFVRLNTVDAVQVQRLTVVR